MSVNYTIVIVKSENWYAGYVKELPGAHTQGRTIEEVKKNIKEAIKMIINSLTTKSVRSLCGTKYTKI
jgi:predicted RNase H-like HicB family nuclease